MLNYYQRLRVAIDRLLRLDAKRETLLREFPQLRQATTDAHDADTTVIRYARQPPRKIRETRKRRLSKAKRKALSQRMKAKWAARRKAGKPGRLDT